MTTTVPALAQKVKDRFPNIVADAGDVSGIPAVVVNKNGIKGLAMALKTDPEFQFTLLADLAGVDYLFWEEKECRFEIVYNLYSHVKNERLFLKVRVAEADAVLDSVSAVWPAANWYEREVWDMFGVRFSGHPNLKRILMYEEFQGHALRKDYPYNKRQPLIGPLN